MSGYHLFWSGPFSQWHSSAFKHLGITFNCAEQFMMYNKALYFDDLNTADMILKEKNPKEQKKLGRQVVEFNVEVWARVARGIVYDGNYNKFTQNSYLFKELISTYPKVLVEASPYDKIWGIGLSESDKDARNPDKWQGKNWLGEVLTNLRNNLMAGKTDNPY